MSNAAVYTVSSLTEAVRGTLEGAFPFVWVRGQVVNLARPQSGHLYFSLRDETAMLTAVWFKGSQKEQDRFDPLTGEVYEDGPRPGPATTLENGREILCAGRLRVYGARGVYQLVVETAQELGQGRLHEEFERLRRKLAALGYFALERKRPLPAHPARVAVITAPTGAALQDFLRIADGRGTGAEIRIHPSPVQGEAAPAGLRAAMARIIAEGWAQVIVLIRGGGSLEDLWAFNDPALASAIFSSPVPVLAGIGHEVDVTLADLTADLRAATPTHAAQLLWPAREELQRRLDALAEFLLRAKRRILIRRQEHLDLLTRQLGWRSPQRVLAAWEERLRSAARRLAFAGQRYPAASKLRLQGASEALRRAPARLSFKRRTLEALEVRLRLSGMRIPREADNRLERLSLRLTALDPHAPLARGYALVRKGDGSFVRSSRMVQPEELLHVMVRDGDIPVRVQGKIP